MPELPDILLYVERLRERLIGAVLTEFAISSPFVLRSVQPTAKEFVGLGVKDVGRLGKRLVLEFEEEYYAVIHLMVAGRLQWAAPSPESKPTGSKAILASLGFDTGRLTLIENSTKKRASISLVRGQSNLRAHRRQALDTLTASTEAFAAAIGRERRTLKRALTDPATFDGIGNAYSDEILFEAKLAPTRLTTSLSAEEIQRLSRSTRTMLELWIEKLKTLYPDFPKPAQITAFRPEFNVHGKFGQACTRCGAPVQRIVYAENETNYCAICQNEGRLLADRSLSRLLKDDWPKMLRVDE